MAIRIIALQSNDISKPQHNIFSNYESAEQLSRGVSSLERSSVPLFVDWTLPPKIHSWAPDIYICIYHLRGGLKIFLLCAEEGLKFCRKSERWDENFIKFMRRFSVPSPLIINDPSLSIISTTSALNLRECRRKTTSADSHIN